MAVQSSEKKTKDKPMHSFFAGAIAGGVEATITYPTEYVKTQLQLQSNNASLSAPVSTVSKPYTGPIDCLIRTVRTTGFLSLYRGLSAMVVGNTTKAAVRFLSYEEFKKALANDEGKLTKLRLLMAGLGAGMVEAVLVVTPSETIKTKLIDDTRLSPNARRYHGFVHGVTSIVRTDGIHGIYQGVSAVMLRQGANQMVRFGTYGTIKDFVAQKWDNDIAVHPLTTFAIGMIAGTVTVYTTMPFDVVKTRMQSLHASQYHNTIHCLIQVGRNEGIAALWKGATPRLGRLLFSGGIVFTVYEECMKIFRKL